MRFRGVIPHQASFLVLDLIVCKSYVVWVHFIHSLCVFLHIFVSFPHFKTGQFPGVSYEVILFPNTLVLDLCLVIG